MSIFERPGKKEPANDNEPDPQSFGEITKRAIDDLDPDKKEKKPSVDLEEWIDGEPPTPTGE